MITNTEQINFNKVVHDKVAKDYEILHTEIFNQIEQERLKQSLRQAVTNIESTKNQPTVLDIGCGTGNLTSHLNQLGLAVTAADISDVFLAQVKTKHPAVKTHQLNGEDLSEIGDKTFDMVVTYSVLHHIPDYLKMVAEMCRVLKPGGVLYIDHEKNESYWQPPAALREFNHKQRWSLLPYKLRRLFSPSWYLNRYRRFINPRYQAEGDIHVWPDDHIEWEKIKSLAKQHQVEVVREMDFLLFNSKYNQKIYQEYQNQISDTKAVIFRKLHG